MAIANFPTSLQAIIQQNFLARGFQEGLRSRLGYRQIADRELFPNRVGETIIKTRAGLKAPVSTPITPASNNNFDNGLTPSTWAVEQYALTINMFADTIDLNMVSDRVGIASQFARNATVNGIQAATSLDRQARDALFGGRNVPQSLGGYLGGNTRVMTTLGAAGTSVKVDDIRGFQFTLNTVGQEVMIATSIGMLVTVGAGVYSLVAAVPDVANISTAPGGISGTLMFATNVSVSDGTAGMAAIAATAPLVVRPNGRQTTAALVAPQGTYGAANYVPGDTLTMDTINQAVASLRMNNVPPSDATGLYHCYMDDLQMTGLYRDPDFKQLFRGAYGSEAYHTAQVVDLLGVRFITTTESPQQASLGAGRIHRAIICGQGALIEGVFEGIGAEDLPEADRLAIIEMIDGVAMVTRPPTDRLGQIISQSWYSIIGWATPSDATANSTTIGTATNAYLKRAVVAETL